MWFSIISWFIFIGVYSAVYPAIKMASDMAGQVRERAIEWGKI